MPDPVQRPPVSLKQKAGWIAIAMAVVIPAEGLYTKAYKDPVGIPTICFGETKGVKMGDVKTVDECKGLLADSLLEANQAVDSCVKVPLNDNQRAAFVSFTYNVGPGRKGVKDGFCTLKNGNPSTMVTRINQRRYSEACDELLKWTTARGFELRGLKIRRTAEREVCYAQPG